MSSVRALPVSIDQIKCTYLTLLMMRLCFTACYCLIYVADLGYLGAAIARSITYATLPGMFYDDEDAPHTMIYCCSCSFK